MLSVNSHQMLTLGETNVLECTGHFHGRLGYLGLRRSDSEDYPSINENPFCNSTVEVMSIIIGVAVPGRKRKTSCEYHMINI